MIVETPIRLEYRYTPGVSASRFLRGIVAGKILGQRCARCRKVYSIPRGCCPMCGVATDSDVELPDRGTVTTYCVVNVPSPHLPVPVPYVCAQVLLDGADITGMFLLQELDPADVRMGMRVEAVWGEPAPSLTSIRYFRPTGEPDAPYETYREYV
jgi:uncharacterized OB-fold protein